MSIRPNLVQFALDRNTRKAIINSEFSLVVPQSGKPLPSFGVVSWDVALSAVLHMYLKLFRPCTFLICNGLKD